MYNCFKKNENRKFGIRSRLNRISGFRVFGFFRREPNSNFDYPKYRIFGSIWYLILNTPSIMYNQIDEIFNMSSHKIRKLIHFRISYLKSIWTFEISMYKLYILSFNNHSQKLTNYILKRIHKMLLPPFCILKKKLLFDTIYLLFLIYILFLIKKLKYSQVRSFWLISMQKLLIFTFYNISLYIIRDIKHWISTLDNVWKSKCPLVIGMEVIFI